MKLYQFFLSIFHIEKQKLFLRSREFYWQEGHTAHKNTEESKEFTIKMLNVYADFVEKCLAIPVIKGQKQKEKNSLVQLKHILQKH